MITCMSLGESTEKPVLNVLIRSGDSEAAAGEVASAIGEIFGTEPTRLPSPVQKPVVRGMIEVALIVLALPPALIGTADLASRSRLRERLGALITRTNAISKTTKSSVLVDLGDGKHIPLEEASREAILAALGEVEKKLKARSPSSPEPANRLTSLSSKAP
jgi:hypothetical protein